MSQTIKRSAKGVRRAAAARGAAQKVHKAKAQTGSFIDMAMRWLPFTEEQLHRIFLAAILGGAVALAWFVANLAGVPAMANEQLATVAANAGFEVRRVEVRGVQRMNELKVYERVLGERDRAMPLVDIGALRQDLLQLSWVKDARVSRQLPDSLVVDIVERVPHAVLRKPGRLVLIDATGHELEPISEAKAKGQLIIEGPGAGQEVPEPLDIVMRIGPVAPHLVGGFAHGDFAAAVEIDQGEFGVGLADVDDADDARRRHARPFRRHMR